MVLLNDINIIGSYASILGTMISIGTLIYAFSINSKVKILIKKVLFNTRVSPIKKELERNSSNLSKLINEHVKNEKDLKLELTLCKASIKSILPKLSKDQQVELKKTESLISDSLNSDFVNTKSNNDLIWYQKLFAKKQLDKNDVWKIYQQLAYSIKILDNLIKDKKVL